MAANNKKPMVADLLTKNCERMGVVFWRFTTVVWWLMQVPCKEELHFLIAESRMKVVMDGDA